MALVYGLLVQGASSNRFWWKDYVVVFQDALTLIGMRGDTFISLSFLDQILTAEFLSKISKLFWRWKLTSIGWTFFLLSNVMLNRVKGGNYIYGDTVILNPACGNFTIKLALVHKIICIRNFLHYFDARK